jgi:cysteine synthase
VTFLGIGSDIVDQGAYQRAVQHFRARGLTLPTFGQLADPSTIPDEVQAALAAVDPNAPDPANLYRVHWHNEPGGRGQVDVPAHLVLGKELTGVDAPILVALGNPFPMIGAHKVQAAYACLVSRLVTGRFDPSAQRAVWPSTGNYCRGGVAISRILDCRGVAVLPEGMSQERFDWLAEWVSDPDDIVRTPGTESNVKEIYDTCNELAEDPANVILNQFCEFPNHLAHYLCTGRALARIFEAAKAARPGLSLAGFTSATGSAGTLAAGDHLKEVYGARVVAVEPLECPTLLYNGFGAHNIQGIGDKHVPLIHNVMNTDAVVAISDRATDALNVVFNTFAGREHLTRERGLSPELVASLANLGLSSICNVLAAIRLARALDLGPNEAVLTVATDGAALYTSEIAPAVERLFPTGFDRAAAAQAVDEHLLGGQDEHLLQLTETDRQRIFNLGYYTWVEQQGTTLEDFEARRDQSFWRGLRQLLPAWDARIAEFNGAVGARTSAT